MGPRLVGNLKRQAEREVNCLVYVPQSFRVEVRQELSARILVDGVNIVKIRNASTWDAVAISKRNL